jgi:hypothetical protein
MNDKTKYFGINLESNVESATMDWLIFFAGSINLLALYLFTFLS